ncbi:STM4015 family protein [Streptosporangium roseum]|uniref:STM4015 family protein n=1 Tax=Streptosporangium roseum TaxID=2001 RepID=UPI0033249DE8
MTDDFLAKLSAVIKGTEAIMRQAGHTHDGHYDHDEEDLAALNAETPADPRDPGEAFIPASGAYHWDMAGAHRVTYAGLPVAGPDAIVGSSPDPRKFAWPLYDGDPQRENDGAGFADGLEELLGRVDGSRIQAIVVIGSSLSNAPGVLAANAHRLPRLRSLFLGFVEPEHWEISWIQQGDITPVLEAFPRLERLDVRGSEGLRLRPVRHASLKVLRFESGGLPGHVVRAVGESELPCLEHLEVWLGVSQYGGDATVGDLRGILSGSGLPALRRLGLRDSEIQDEVAAAVASAPVGARLEALSLSMGALTDAGAESLLSGQPFTHLRHLDLHYHFLTDDMAARVRLALPGVEVDLSEPQPSLDEWRYVAVSE